MSVVAGDDVKVCVGVFSRIVLIASKPGPSCLAR